MKRLTLICFLFVSLMTVIKLNAQTTFPTTDGERVKYSAYIEMPHQAYISGICVLLREDGNIMGCLFNEFGITAIDFTYYTEHQKVKLHDVIKMLDRWYIRRILRKDIAQLMNCLQKGENKYINERQKIIYQFTIIEDETKE